MGRRCSPESTLRSETQVWALLPGFLGRNSAKGLWMMRVWHKQLIVLCLLLSACSGPFLNGLPVEAVTSITRAACDRCEETTRFVRLQQVLEGSRSAHPRSFAHPFVLTSEDWVPLLKGLQVQRQAEGLLFRDPPSPVLPAFTPDEIAYLSWTLSQAFARAQPNEMVVFGLTRLNAYNMTEITTGGWFLEGASLHLIVANYRKAATMPSTRQLLWERPLRPDAGPYYDLVAGRHQAIVRDAGVWSDLFSSAPPELSIAYRAALLEESPDAAPLQQNRPSSSDVVSPALSLDERLRTLKQLHDQGLISDDDYRVKKQQLLDRL